MLSVTSMSNDTKPNPTQPVWFDISSRSPRDTSEYYRNLLGWQVDKLDDENYSFISTGEGPPSGGIGDGSGEAPYVGLVAFFPVEDLDATLARAAELNGEVVMGPAPTPGGRIAAIKDPQGTVIGVRGA